MSNSPVRYVGLHHVAFFRSAFESDLQLQDIAVRYLETGQDLPAAKRTLKFVEGALCQAAKRRGKHGAAALLRVPRGRFREQAPVDTDATKIPSLDQYAADVDPDGFYREAELLDMYQAEYGSLIPASLTPAQARRQERNLRLLMRKVRLINDLAQEITQPPTLEDLIEGWFDPRVANRLTAVKIENLGDLIIFMNHRGYRWYRAIPRMGEVTAKRILSFLAGSEISGSLSPYALTPVKDLRKSGQPRMSAAPVGAIVPLEQIKVPASELNGSQGANRAIAGRNRLHGDDDLSAVNSWLGLYRGNTERAYRKEVERMLLWSIYAKHKPFSSLTTEDVGQYARFLESPAPREVWVADRRYDRFHPAWRPFVKSGLSRRSIAYAVQVLSTMSHWLVGQRYLDSNPFDGLPRMNAGGWQPLSRSLSHKQWEAVQRCTKALPDDLAGARMRFFIALAYGTGMRIHELAKATLGDLHTYSFGGNPVVYLHILGKGQKEREVPFAKSLATLLQHAYLKQRGLQYLSLHELPDQTPLIAQLEHSEIRMSTRGIDHAIRGLFHQVALTLDESDPEEAKGILRASTHWMRHTHATYALDKNIPLKTVRDNLGHASLSTTSLYVHTELADRYREIDSFLSDLA